MEVTVDFSSVQKLSNAISRYGRIMPTPKATAVLRKSASPMLRRAQSEVPVSMGGRMRTSLKHKTLGAQGGATRRDLRIKSVQPNGAELARVIVGVSKRKGKVGWRALFILYGTKVRQTKSGANRGRVKANNFLLRAYSATFPGVAEDFQREFRVAFANWARANFPQIGV
jgi:hypothetical protein